MKSLAEEVETIKSVSMKVQLSSVPSNTGMSCKFLALPLHSQNLSCRIANKKEL